VASYWPYATTLFDYIRRAMPVTHPHSLNDHEVYALVAYILSIDGIVKKDAVLDAKSLPKIKMPNRDGFIDESAKASMRDILTYYDSGFQTFHFPPHALAATPLLLLPVRAGAEAPSWQSLADLERQSGARIGVAAIDTGSAGCWHGAKPSAL